jgi:hypothetical protein
LVKTKPKPETSSKSPAGYFRSFLCATHNYFEEENGQFENDRKIENDRKTKMVDKSKIFENENVRINLKSKKIERKKKLSVSTKSFYTIFNVNHTG